jgi:hypothetical protein
MTAIQVAQQLDPFADDDVETYIQVAINGAIEPEQVPIDSPTGLSLVRSMLAEHKERGIPTDHEVRAMVAIIKGIAYRRQRKPALIAAKHQIAQRPLAQAVLVIAKEGGTRADLPRLLAKVNHVVERESIEIKGKSWPKNEDALGCQLSSIQKLLAAVGVPIVRNENDRPRTWTIPPDTSSDGSLAKVTGRTDHPETTSETSDTSTPNQRMAVAQQVEVHSEELDNLIQEVVHERG